jgi:type II secretory pathway component PulK
VLVCLAVAGLIFAGLLRLVTLDHRRIEQRQRVVQAEWLVESALERAVAQLAADAKYAGESWKVSAEELSGKQSAAVELRVNPVEGQPAARSVRVEAQLGDAPGSLVRHNKQVTLHLPTGVDP